MRSLGSNILNSFFIVVKIFFLHSPPCVFQGPMVLENELLEAEVSLERDVVLQVRGGKCVPVQYEGLAGHELHESLAEVPHQPLL